MRARARVSPMTFFLALFLSLVASAMQPGSVLVDCSTVSPATAKKIAAALAVTGVGAVDAPVSGGSEGARKGTLTIFVGGEEKDVQAALPALQTFAGSITSIAWPWISRSTESSSKIIWGVG